MVIKVLQFNFQIISNLRGHMEATTDSEATKMVVRGNMHINTRVIEVNELKYDVI